MNESITETDPAKRTEKLLAAEAVIMEEMPVAPIYYNTNLNVVSDEVENMAPDALGNINLKYVKVK